MWINIYKKHRAKEHDLSSGFLRPLSQETPASKHMKLITSYLIFGGGGGGAGSENRSLGNYHLSYPTQTLK